jgi:hypothetical protein
MRLLPISFCATAEIPMEMVVIAVMIGKAWFCEKPTWRNKTADCPLGCLVPAYVECAEFRKKLKLAIWQIVVNPPGHRPPARARLHPIDQKTCAGGNSISNFEGI